MDICSGLQLNQQENRYILASNKSNWRNMFVAERFLHGMIKIHGNHPISIGGGGTMYPMACQFLKLKRHIHPSLFGKKLHRNDNSVSQGKDPKKLFMINPML
jgi:hypothetical protein